MRAPWAFLQFNTHRNSKDPKKTTVDLLDKNRDNYTNINSININSQLALAKEVHVDPHVPSKPGQSALLGSRHQLSNLIFVFFGPVVLTPGPKGSHCHRGVTCIIMEPPGTQHSTDPRGRRLGFSKRAATWVRSRQQAETRPGMLREPGRYLGSSRSEVEPLTGALVSKVDFGF
ncbi:hypothetical protein CB1_000699006 [Camelus ferus]|nr:hypothetical protein CB1_000699006 [Camelus ferus]